MIGERLGIIVELGRGIASGEFGYADALDDLLRVELQAGRWDGEPDGELLLQNALADAAAAELDGLDATTAVLRHLMPEAVPHWPAPEHTPASAIAAMQGEIRSFIAAAVAHTAAARAWAAKLAAIDAVTPPKTPGRRAALRQARAKMAAAHGGDWRAPGRRVLVGSPAGAGKSTFTAAEIVRAGEALGTVWVAVRRLEDAEDLARLIPGAAVVRGRGAINPEDPEGGRMCARHETAAAVARAGLPVGPTLCKNDAGVTCPLFASCAYQRRRAWMRSGEPRIFIFAHEYLTQPATPMPPPDVVIVDERCFDVFVARDTIALDRLLEDAMPDWQRAGPALAIEFRRTMAAVREARNHADGILAGLRAGGLDTAAAFDGAIRYTRAVEEEDTAGLLPTMADDAIIERAETFIRSETGAIRRLLIALQGEISAPRDQANGVAFDPHAPVTVNGRAERQARFAVHYLKRPGFGSRVPVMLLDASGDPEVNRRIFGDHLAHVALRCERSVTVIQVRDATFPTSSLTGTNKAGAPLSATSIAKAERLRGEIASVTNALAYRHGGDLFLASAKAVEALLRPDLNEDVLTGHYGALRGRNDFQECPAGAVLGRQQPPPGAMEDLARAMFAMDPDPLQTSDRYRKEIRRLRMRDGSTIPIKVDVHPDPRVQRLLELHRERESEQAADRLRLIHNATPKTLYVLSDVPLDLTVDRVTTWRALVHEATGRLDNARQGKGRRLNSNRLAEAFRFSGGVLPLSRSLLMRLFGPEGSLQAGIWQSERAISDDLGKGAVSAIGVLFAETAPFQPVPVRFRLKGQRGSDCQALVAMPGAAGRAALEALVGPLAAYEVEGTPPKDHPPAQPPPPAPEPSRPVPATPIMLPTSPEIPAMAADPFAGDGLPPATLMVPTSPLAVLFTADDALVASTGRSRTVLVRDASRGFVIAHPARPLPDEPVVRRPAVWRIAPSSEGPVRPSG